MSESPQIVRADSRWRAACRRLLRAELLLLPFLVIAPIWAVLSNSPLLMAKILGLVLLVYFLVLFRRYGPDSWLGPSFFYDMVRTARRSRSFLLRCVYILLLLAGFCQAYITYFQVAPWSGGFASRRFVALRDQARFNHTAVIVFLVAQGGAVLVMTPVYLASAIAEEKERRTLPLLFTTHLRDHEIILGKMMARLAHLGQILLAGLPVFLLMGVTAGKEVIVLTMGTFIATAMTLLSLGSVSMLCSVLCRQVLTAILCSYGCLLVFQVACLFCASGVDLYVSSPVAFPLALNSRLEDPELSLPALRPRPVPGAATPTPPAPPASMFSKATLFSKTTGMMIGMTIAYVFIHGLLSLFCILLAICWLRPVGLALPSSTRAAARPRLVPVSNAFGESNEISPQSPNREWTRLPLPPVYPRCPLLWKEMFCNPARAITVEGRLGKIALVLVLLLGALFWELVVTEPPEVSLQFVTEQPEAWLPHHSYLFVRGALLRVLGIATAMAWCIGAGMRAAGSFSRERDRRTLSMLLMLPVERQEVLRAKWLGGILRFRTLALLLVAFWSIGLLTKSLHPFGALLLAVSCAVLLSFLASLGVWLSQACRNTEAAHLCMALLLLLLFGVSWYPLLDPHAPGELTENPADWFAHLSEVGVNPMVSWWLAAFSWSEWSEAIRVSDALFWARLRAVLQGTALFGGLALVFWLAARRRLSADVRG